MLYRSLLATALCLALSIPSVQAQNSELVSITNFNNILPADCDSLLPPLIINNSNGTFTVDYELDLSLNMFPTGIQNYSTIKRCIFDTTLQAASGYNEDKQYFIWWWRYI